LPIARLEPTTRAINSCNSEFATYIVFFLLLLLPALTYVTYTHISSLQSVASFDVQRYPGSEAGHPDQAAQGRELAVVLQEDVGEVEGDAASEVRERQLVDGLDWDTRVVGC